jgi:hypothetical protein
MISGIPSVLTLDKNNHCRIVLENCALYEVTLERGDILGLIEIEEEELIPLTYDVI